MRFTSDKQQALLRGDTSGVILNPFFIHGAQSLGMYFCEGVEKSPAMVRLHAKHVQTCLESILEVFREHDWELRAQVALWVTAGSVTIWALTLAGMYIKKGCEAINTGGLQFVPTYGRPPEFSEGLHEKLSVLSQIIYFENFLFLTCGGAVPTMTARIEEEFRRKLPVRHLVTVHTYVQRPSQEVYPVLFKICPLTMRTQTILLVRDTVDMLNLRPTDGKYRLRLLLRPTGN